MGLEDRSCWAPDLLFAIFDSFGPPSFHLRIVILTNCAFNGFFSFPGWRPHAHPLVPFLHCAPLLLSVQHSSIFPISKSHSCLRPFRSFATRGHFCNLFFPCSTHFCHHPNSFPSTTPLSFCPEIDQYSSSEPNVS